MDSSENHALRQKVWEIHNYIQEELYLNRPDMEVRGTRFNSALLMSLLTTLSRGKALIIGEPGLGKTTSAEYVSSLFYRFPMGIVWGSEVPGHPEQTEEKIIGRPDLGRLNQGEEVVVWSHFVLLPIKIVDEINRLPETKQSMILDGVDRGNWEYLNDAIVNEEYCLFATANYQDRGTNTIISPLIDRFDIIVESKHPGANLASLVGAKGSNGVGLRHQALEKEFRMVLSGRMPYEERIDQLEVLCDRFGESLAESPGVGSLSREERRSVHDRTAAIPFDLDASAFLRFVLSELSFCQRFGQKRSNESCPEGCHFTGYLCHAVRNCISNRFPISARCFSQAMAWFLGDEEVELEHLRAVLPFALAHRIQWKEESLSQKEKDPRSDPLLLYMAKEAVKDLHRRYVEQGNRVKGALAVAARIVEGEEMGPLEGDHPIYWEIMKDLGEEVTEE